MLQLSKKTNKLNKDNKKKCGFYIITLAIKTH